MNKKEGGEEELPFADTRFTNYKDLEQTVTKNKY